MELTLDRREGVCGEELWVLIYNVHLTKPFLLSAMGDGQHLNPMGSGRTHRLS